MKEWLKELFSSNEDRVAFISIIAGMFCGVAIYQYVRFNDVSNNLNEFLKWLLSLVVGNSAVTATKNVLVSQKGGDNIGRNDK